MLILGLLGMYFVAEVVFFTMASLFFRMAMAVLCPRTGIRDKVVEHDKVKRNVLKNKIQTIPIHINLGHCFYHLVIFALVASDS